jgi:hypothetical protein
VVRQQATRRLSLCSLHGHDANVRPLAITGLWLDDNAYIGAKRDEVVGLLPSWPPIRLVLSGVDEAGCFRYLLP